MCTDREKDINPNHVLFDDLENYKGGQNIDGAFNHRLKQREYDVLILNTSVRVQHIAVYEN